MRHFIAAAIVSSDYELLSLL